VVSIAIAIAIARRGSVRLLYRRRGTTG
jgi:hypothetical protein